MLGGCGWVACPGALVLVWTMLATLDGAACGRVALGARAFQTFDRAIGRTCNTPWPEARPSLNAGGGAR